MIRAAICDNVQEQCQIIKQRIQAYFFQSGEDVIYSIYTDMIQLLVDIVKDMLHRKWESEFIFLTESPQFAAKAIYLKTSHCLVKPFTEQAFNKIMDNVMMRIQQYHSQKVVFYLTSNGIQVEKIHHINYLESDGHIQVVHLSDGSLIKVKQSLASLQNILDRTADGQFVSPSKGYIVNQAAIHVIKSNYIEIRGEMIPLVKRRYRMFLRNYLNFIFKYGVSDSVDKSL